MPSKSKRSNNYRSGKSKNRPTSSNRNVNSKKPSTTSQSGGTKSRPTRQISSSISSTSQSHPKTGKTVSKDTSQTSYPSTTHSTVGTQSDALATRLSAAQSNWDRIASGIALTSLMSGINAVSQNLDLLGQKLGNVRARGYRFGRDWESQMSSLQGRWPEQRQMALHVLEDQRRLLQNSAQEIELMLQRATRNAGLLSSAETRIAGFQNNIFTAENRVRQAFTPTQQQAVQIEKELDDALFALDALENASFDLLSDEHAITACKAIWTDGPDEPEGLLFLTDSRLIFEQRQEVATKKVLFVTTEKKMIQEMLWDSPIGAVDELESEDQKAFLRRKEMLTLRFSERTRDIPSDITLQLVGSDNETWTSLIRRAKSGQIDAERFGAPPPEELLAAEVEAEEQKLDKELPTKCPNCHAPLPPVFKGMKQLECEYCGAVVNI